VPGRKTVEKKTRANGRASRQAILEAALDVFAERGYRGTSLTEIATRVGMTQPGLLHHFGTKEDLLLEVVRTHEERTGPDVVSHLDPGALHLQEAIEALGNVNAPEPVEQLLLTTLSAEAVPEDHPLHEHFVQRYRDNRRRLAQTLRRAQAAGSVRADIDPATAATEIIATLDGLRLQWLLDPKKVDLQQALSAYAGRLAAELVDAG
jgi:AcrR family transcriptional regulator